MYRYDEFDRQVVDERVAQFREQVDRRLAGRLTEEEFKPLRLMNGLYLQLHAYMLRIAIPYGTLSSDQMRRLADIGDKYDKGYGHFTTRQNIQFNWPKLEDVPAILGELAEVEMHAIQTSGNCIRNVTSDPWAGVAADEIEDPRPTAELIRQWSTFHPEFSFLPRKFKIAVTGSPNDRAAVKVHDIGLRMIRNDVGIPGYEVIVGGGQGRTPFVGVVLRPFLPTSDLLAYLEAIMRVYNLHGRRDNKYKARIKILVHEEGIDKIRDEIEAEFSGAGGLEVEPDVEEMSRIANYFASPVYEELPDKSAVLDAFEAQNPEFAKWARVNVAEHKKLGYAIANISLKPIGEAPGDATSDQMRAVAKLADQYSLSEIRVTHTQNLVLANVKKDDLHVLWEGLVAAKLADANLGLVTDIIACPGLDFCALATARSIPIAQAISNRFSNGERQSKIGELSIKISGCINACGHHHVGHIGILGLEKRGEEFYQISLGGDATEDAAIGEIVGKGFAHEEVADAVETIVDAYLAQRVDDEKFIETYRRLGAKPFKEALYAAN
jgi:sulfite reductase (NADPH) hemoprotein beta-component